MASIEETAVCRAPGGEVWKLLYDPARFADWWAGIERVEGDGEEVTRYKEAWPDFAYPTRVTASSDRGRVTVSCLLSDICHQWTLRPHPQGCRVDVRVDVPPEEAERLAELRDELAASLRRLVAAAEREARL